MIAQQPKPRVALVYPPYGPIAPPLGPALLSAGVKKMGFECRTFYWNIDFIRSYPARQARRRVAMHRTVSHLFLMNESVFVKQVFPDADDNDPRIAARLAAMEAQVRAARKQRHSFVVESGLARERVLPTVLIPTLRAVAGDAIEAMAERLASYDIVGISSTFSQNMAALALARRVKTKWPEKTIVLGGANCDDIMGETLRTQFDFIDYVFSGEVDFSFPEFVRRMSVGESVADVPGIVYRDAQGRLTKGPAAVPIENLDDLPIPDYDDYVATRQSSDVREMPLTLTLESSRGCWWGATHQCVFCGLNANGMGFRPKGQQRFQWELEQIVQRYRPQHLAMTDNIISTSYYGDFVDWARERRLGVDFFYEIKANLNRKQVDRLADAGIKSLQPGIESFSSHVLSLMRKGIQGIQNVAFLKYASDSGVSVFYNILGGFRGEDPDDYQKMARNIRALVHLQPPVFGVATAQYHRFSPMFMEAKGHLRPDPGYAELYPFPEDTIANLAYHFEDKEPRSHTYFEPVSSEVLRWRKSWSERGCTLTWTTVDNAVLIRDRRPGFTRQNLRLTGHAVAVFHALDKPRKLQAVARELSPQRKVELTVIQPGAGQDGGTDSSAVTTHTASLRGWRRLRQRIVDRLTHEESVSFTADEFERHPEGCLKGLVDAGVIYVDDDSYLTLPVLEVRRPRQIDWVGNYSIPGFGDRFWRLAQSVRASFIDWREVALNRLLRQN